MFNDLIEIVVLFGTKMARVGPKRCEKKAIVGIDTADLKLAQWNRFTTPTEHINLYIYYYPF